MALRFVKLELISFKEQIENLTSLASKLFLLMILVRGTSVIIIGEKITRHTDNSCICKHRDRSALILTRRKWVRAGVELP